MSNSTQLNSTQLNSTQLNSTQLNSTQLNSTQLNSTLLEQIRDNKNLYSDFKNQIINQQNYSDENLMGFALLVALNFDDNQFIELLSTKFDFDDTKYSFKRKKLHCPWIAFAKAYNCIKQNKRQEAKYIFWRIFAEVSPDYFSKKDFLLLINLLTESNETNDIQNCNLLVQYCSLKYNNDIDFKIEQAKYQLANENNNTNYKNKHNENIELLLKHSNNINIEDLQSLYNLCFFVFAEENNFYKFAEKSILSLKYQKIINNNENKFLYDQKLRLDDINEIINILESIGEKPFLDGGTLLGMYRDGKLMSYDADADLALLIDDEKRKNIDSYIFKIRNSIHKNSKKFNTRLIGYERTFSSISVENTILNTHVDLEFYHKHYFNENFNDINKCFVGAKSKLNTLMWEFDDFNLVKQNLAGKDYWIPENPDHFLEQLYGKDWKNPNSLWISMLSCPNLSKKSKLYVCNFGINYLIRYLSENNYEKANYVYKELQRWEYPFTDAMKNHIESYLQQIKNNK